MLSYHIFVVRSMIYCISSDIFNIFCIILGNYGLLNDFLIKSSDWMSRNVNILDRSHQEKISKRFLKCFVWNVLQNVNVIN